MPFRFARLFLAFAFASALVVRTAEAAEPDTVEVLLQKGSEARSQGRDEEALKYFEQADAARKSPTTRAQIALAEQALGLWVRAENHLLEALAQPDDPWVQKHKPALEGALATIRQHLGTLEVRGLAPDVSATFVVDGAVVGKTPLAAGLRVESGKRLFEVRAPGYHTLTRTVWIPEGGVARETVNLVRSTETKPASEDHTTVNAPASTSSTRRTLGWVSIAVGGAAAAFGGVSLVLRQGATDSYNSPECPGVGAGVPQSATCQSYIDAESTWKTVAIASFIGAGAFLVTGVVLVATGSPSSSAVAPRSSRSNWIECGAGFLCPARF